MFESAVPGTKSFLSWMGGKSLLASKIIPLAPEHQTYCEVFAGAGWVLFRKPESKSETINDINVDLVNLYRVVQHHLEEFIRYFKWVLISREQFEQLKAVDPKTLTDIQRAARFYYLVKVGFASRLRSPSFGTATTAKPRLNLTRIEEDLSAAHLRLSRVTVENLPYDAFIDRYDRPATWFYLDPPYFGCESDYGVGIWQRSDFERLADQLSRIKGKFTLSINDTPEIRDTFGRFNMRKVATRYSASKQGSKPVNELLILNYKAG